MKTRDTTAQKIARMEAMIARIKETQRLVDIERAKIPTDDTTQAPVQTATQAAIQRLSEALKTRPAYRAGEGMGSRRAELLAEFRKRDTVRATEVKHIRRAAGLI